MTENRSHGVSGLAVYGYEAEDEDYLSFPDGATIFEIVGTCHRRQCR
jgi:hypothetical protein